MRGMGRKRYVLLAAAALGVLSLGVLLWPGVSGEGQQTALTVLTIGTADSGGTMYPVGKAIADTVEHETGYIKVNTSASNGSDANVEGLRSGQVDLGLVSSDVAYRAYRGEGEFDHRPMEELRTIGAVYSSLSNWIVLRSSDLYSVHDLKGQTVALGPEGSATERSASTALAVLGIRGENTRFENHGLAAGGEAMLKGTIDAMHGFAGAPIAGLTALAQQYPCRILNYTQEELDAILARDPAYVRMTIPAGTYPGQEEDVDTFGVKCLLSVRADMDEELVYALTKILYDARPQLGQAHPSMAAMADPSFLCQELKVPLHPGAQRFYQEQGLLD